MSTKTQRDSDEAREKLLDPDYFGILPGMVIHTVLRHRSASGMTHWISPFIFKVGRGDELRIFDATYQAGKLLGWSTSSENYDGVKVEGAGMDMGFHLVYSMSRLLWPDGFMCIGDRCPSNDHINGDRDRAPHPHKDGGYALKHRWL